MGLSERKACLEAEIRGVVRRSADPSLSFGGSLEATLASAEKAHKLFGLLIEELANKTIIPTSLQGTALADVAVALLKKPVAQVGLAYGIGLVVAEHLVGPPEEDLDAYVKKWMEECGVDDLTP